jgi:hypothetical protein
VWPPLWLWPAPLMLCWCSGATRAEGRWLSLHHSECWCDYCIMQLAVLLHAGEGLGLGMYPPSRAALPRHPRCRMAGLEAWAEYVESPTRARLPQLACLPAVLLRCAAALLCG